MYKTIGISSGYIDKVLDEFTNKIESDCTEIYYISAPHIEILKYIIVEEI